MSKNMKLFFAVIVVLMVSATNIFAITRVAARYNVMEFNVSSAQPQGSYNRIGVGAQGIKFDGGLGQSFDIDADDLYKNSTSFGINYGRLINDNVLFNVGFSFINAKHKEVFEDPAFIYTYPEFFKLRMFNFDFNWNYYFMPPVQQTLAPYAGVGIQTGLLSVSVTDFASESDFILATSINFGADLKVWKSSDEMGFLTISSVNSYQFYASENRPKYLTIGASLKYFMRP